MYKNKDLEVGQIVKFVGYISQFDGDVKDKLNVGELVELTHQEIAQNGSIQFNARSIIHKGVIDTVLVEELEEIKEDEKSFDSKLGILYEIRNLIGTIDEFRFTLGGYLSYIKEYMLYHELGYTGKKGFDTYVEKELGMHPRQIANYIVVYNVLSALGLTEKDLKGIKWSALLKIAGIANFDNIDELLDYCRKNSVSDVEAFVKAYSTRTSHSTEMIDITQAEQMKLHKLTLAMFEDQYEGIMKPAIEEARLRMSNSNAETGECVLYILQEWLLFTSKSSLENIVSFVQQKFGVNLTPLKQSEKNSLVENKELEIMNTEEDNLVI